MIHRVASTLLAACILSGDLHAQAGNVSDERVSVARILGILYAPENREGQNAFVLSQLQKWIHSGERDLANAALISYARLPYHPDTLDLLAYGFAHQIISEDEYCRELAFGLVSGEPLQAQLVAAQRLAQAKSERAGESLAAVFGSPHSLSGLAPAALAPVLSALAKHEPLLPSALGQFGVIAGDHYARWLHSVALLTQAADGTSYEVTVLLHLDDERTDPRKILGYLSSVAGMGLMTKVGQRRPFERAADRAFAFADQFPDHPSMSPMARDIRAALAALPD